MSEIVQAKVIENRQIAPDIYDLRIYSPGQAARAVAGQFLGIYTDNAAMLLPRPLSICEIDADKGILRVVYRVVGGGTREIAGVQTGEELRVLGPLGNGYTIDDSHRNIAIAGGGLGVPPLLGLAASIRKAVPDAKIAVYLGFRDKSAVILESDFGKYADEVAICTDDGSYGFHGNVLSALSRNPRGVPGQARNDGFDVINDGFDGMNDGFDVIYGCGPKPMLKALAAYASQANLTCFVSLEEHMACCVGTCLACVVKVQQNGSPVNKRACYDGPVFNAKEVLWE